MPDETPDQAPARRTYFALDIVFHAPTGAMFFTARLWRNGPGHWQGRVDSWLDQDLARAGAIMRLTLSKITFDEGERADGKPRMLTFDLAYDGSGRRDRFSFMCLDDDWYGSRLPADWIDPQLEYAHAMVTPVRRASMDRQAMLGRFSVALKARRERTGTADPLPSPLGDLFGQTQR